MALKTDRNLLISGSRVRVLVRLPRASAGKPWSPRDLRIDSAKPSLAKRERAAARSRRAASGKEQDRQNHDRGEGADPERLVRQRLFGARVMRLAQCRHGYLQQYPRSFPQNELNRAAVP